MQSVNQQITEESQILASYSPSLPETLLDLPFFHLPALQSVAIRTKIPRYSVLHCTGPVAAAREGITSALEPEHKTAFPLSLKKLY